MPTVFFVHGNQMTRGDAKSEGLALYRKLVNYGSGEQRIRFVIFSWPSAKVGGLLNDVRVKAQRTGPAGCQLAWLLDQMPAETPVSLVGFSFGARVITGGLHILGGGSVCNGMALDERVHPDRAPMNAVLIAAAVHAHWLGEGQYHGLAMTQVEPNVPAQQLPGSGDAVLSSLDDRIAAGPQALGSAGPTRIDSEYAAKIHKRDVSRYAGSRARFVPVPVRAGAVGQVWEYAVSAPADGRRTASGELVVARLRGSRTSRTRDESATALPPASRIPHPYTGLMATTWAYLNGRWIPDTELSIGVDDVGFLLGATVTERLRTFRGQVFRLDEHLRRLRHSLEIVGLPADEIAAQIGARDRRIRRAQSRRRSRRTTTGRSWRLRRRAFPAPGRRRCAFTDIRCRLHAGRRSTRTACAWSISDVRQIPPQSLPPELKCRSRMHFYLADRRAAAAQPGARADPAR